MALFQSQDQEPWVRQYEGRMIELFNAIFYSFWTFVGTLMLLAVATQGVVALAAILFGRKP